MNRAVPMPVIEERRAPPALLHGALDPLVAVGTFVGCKALAGSPWATADVVLLLLVFSLMYPGLRPNGGGVRQLARDVFAGWALAAAVLLGIGWTSGTLGHFEGPLLAAWAIATPVLLFSGKLVLARLLAAERVQRHAVIAGEGPLGQSLAQRLRACPDTGIHFVGYFDDRSAARSPGVLPQEKLGPLSAVAGFVQRHAVDLIYVTLPMSSQPRLRQLLADLHDTTASVYFVPDVFLFDLIQAHTDNVGGIPVIAIRESPFYGIDGAVKFVEDIVLASLILALLAPLMLAIAVAVKATSPGPVLFRQRRYGLDGREIVVYKFRTMRVMEDGDVVRQARRDDPRVTPLGAFLRRTSLDELPQFINVLQGRMSVIGPRPHAVAHNELYRKLIAGYMIRHKVRPGVTGLAQIRGFRGETDDVEKMRARVESDLEYLRRWSLLLDLEILLRTLPAMLFSRNAY